MSTGVGQLVLTFGFPSEQTRWEQPKDDAQQTEGNGPAVSNVHPEARNKPERKEGKEPRKPQGKRKWHSLIDKVYLPRNLQAAWERVRANGGAAGIDGITVGQFARRADERLAALSADLRAKTYRPQPVRRAYIPKSGGGKRPLGIPTVRDRVVQQALLQVLQPIFEAKFSSRSHGFRPERGCATALEVVDRAIACGYGWVVDADVQAFFDSVQHEKLLDLLNEEVADGSVLRLIRHILTAGVIEPGASEVEPTALGTPQGGPLSPLLANIYLHPLDVRMQAAGYGLVRYADDFVVFAKSESEARQALALAQQVLQGELGLSLHPEKTAVVSVDAGFEFLGFHYFRDPKTGVRCKEVRLKSVARFRDAIRERTPRLHAQRAVKARHVTYERLAKNQRVTSLIQRVNGFVRGWHWYFKTARERYSYAKSTPGVHSPRAPFESFDGFIRRRVRAAIVGRTGSGWWNHLLTNAMLRRLGLLVPGDLHELYQSGLLAAPVRKD
jgi:RNA-directed DNA polymerase